MKNEGDIRLFIKQARTRPVFSHCL